MPNLDKTTRQLLNKARQLSGGSISIYLEDHELLRICMIVASDLGKSPLISHMMANEVIASDYYSIPLEWFDRPLSTNTQFTDAFLLLQQNIPDFATYFEKLCELHKRRRKFQRILEQQALPQMEQIVPRCLLEFGLRPSETLASWLVWRKWLYDIDNRSAQETGYLFEPILAAAIGGIPCAASKSPVRRVDNPLLSRQVDCLDGKLAYEFKMRVTDAASSQGRFSEELGFALDCHSSGYTPILLVLDPTPSTRLNSLKAEYAKYGGSAFIGNEAWIHLEEKAGEVMGKFIEKYVRTPIREMTNNYTVLHSIQLDSLEATISIKVGKQSFSIRRTKPQLNSEAIDTSIDQ